MYFLRIVSLFCSYFLDKKFWRNNCTEIPSVNIYIRNRFYINFTSKIDIKISCFTIPVVVSNTKESWDIVITINHNNLKRDKMVSLPIFLSLKLFSISQKNVKRIFSRIYKKSLTCIYLVYIFEIFVLPSIKQDYTYTRMYILYINMCMCVCLYTYVSFKI